MTFILFEQPCTKCGKANLGPREGGKARGRWLGYDQCVDILTITLIVVADCLFVGVLLLMWLAPDALAAVLP